MREQLIGVSGVLTATVITPDPDAVVIEGMEWDGRWEEWEACGEAAVAEAHRHPSGAKLWVASPKRHNAFVNSGLQNMLDRWAAGTGTSPTRIACSSDNTAVTASTLTFGGTFRSSTMNATFPSRSAQTTSFQADFTKGSGSNQIDFSVRKLGLTNASADTSGAVQDIIGGAGSSPYNEALTIDLTSTTSFTFRPQIDVTLTAI